ncbi:MAG: glycosyltransferase [Pirellulales bacterium]
MKLSRRHWMMFISTAMVLVYLTFRAAFTLNLSTGYATFASLLLYLGEAWGCFLMLLYFVQIWHPVEPKPCEPWEGKSVDVLIPTYNEDAHLLRGTIRASVDMDYPHRTYVLDDGRRPEIRALAEELGAEYIARPDNLHAKAGNLNYALRRTQGEFVVLLDADHIAAPHFINRLIGYFRDEKLAFVQTPHSFYNFDNFAASIDYRRHIYWEEGQLFYHYIQPGKNYWNAAMFCGSATLFRRSALEDAGLVATESITEDMLTSVRVHARGWKSLFVNERLITGQAAPDITTFATQRLRWGAGNLSVLAYANPLTTRGLTLAQRINYLGTALFWTNGVSKLAIYLTPILMLFTGVAPVAKFSWTLLLVTSLYLLISCGAMKGISGHYARFGNIELAAMTNFWFQIRATALALLARNRLRYVVTSKRGQQNPSVVRLVVPQMILVALGLLSIGWAGSRLAFHLTADWLGTAIGTVLVLLEVFIAWKVIRRALRPKDLRFTWRHPCMVHVLLREGDRPVCQGMTVDLSDCGLAAMTTERLPAGDTFDLTIQAPTHRIDCRGIVRNSRELAASDWHGERWRTAYRHGIEFVDLTLEQSAALWAVLTQYAVPRQYQEFESMQTRPILVGRKARHLHLPAMLSARGAPGERSARPFGAVTEGLGPSAFEALLPEPQDVGALVDFAIASAAGEITGEAEVEKVVSQQVGVRPVQRHSLRILEFRGDSEQRLRTLLAEADAGARRTAMEEEPHVMRSPALRPALKVLTPTAIAACLLVGVFHLVYRDEIILHRVADRVANAADYNDAVSRIAGKFAAGRSADPARAALLRQALLVLNRKAEAERLDPILLAEEPDNLGLRLAWANYLGDAGRFAEAEAQYAHILGALDQGPPEPGLRREVLLASARNAAHHGRAKLAVARFERALGPAGGSLPLREEYAGLLIAAGRGRDAVRLLSATRLDAHGRLLLASAYLGVRDFAGAEKVYEGIVRDNPRDSRAAEMLADVQSWRRQYPAAVAGYEKLLAGKPGNPRLERKLAAALVANNQPEKALAYLDRAVAREPGSLPLRLQLADTLHRVGNYRAAERQYTTLITQMDKAREAEAIAGTPSKKKVK